MCVKDTASTSIHVDGGMTMNGLLMQFQSDLLRSPLVRPEFVDITALGAAFAAGLAVGVWKDMDEVKKVHMTLGMFIPSPHCLYLVSFCLTSNDTLTLFALCSTILHRPFLD